MRRTSSDTCHSRRSIKAVGIKALERTRAEVQQVRATLAAPMASPEHFAKVRSFCGRVEEKERGALSHRQRTLTAIHALYEQLTLNFVELSDKQAALQWASLEDAAAVLPETREWLAESWKVAKALLVQLDANEAALEKNQDALLLRILRVDGAASIVWIAVNSLSRSQLFILK